MSTKCVDEPDFWVHYTVAPLLGHASIQTTHDIYVHLTPEDLKQALEDGRKRRHDDER